jgi:dsRNA-specific ribonuclease
MDEERKKLEAIGDGLLLAIARLYLREQHADVEYKIHMRLISLLVRNSTLAQIAEGEGIKGREGEKLSDALEIAIALHYYRAGFDSVRVWLWRLFEKYVDIKEEVRLIQNPTPQDKMLRKVQGALHQAVSTHGSITVNTVEKTAKMVVARLSDQL